MADIVIPQEEADNLINASKEYHGPQKVEYPAPGESLNMQCESHGGSERYHLDVYRGRIELTKASHNLRVRIAIPLLRLDIGGRPHKNPDGERIDCPHLHVYREGYGDAWAYELPDEVFNDVHDLPQTLKDFMDYCNIQNQPSIEGNLF